GPNALVSSSSIFSSPTRRGGATKVLDAGKVGEEGPQRGYSNLQFAISPPHEELGVIISSGRDLEIVEEALSGNLTELGAKLLLVRDGQEDITPLKASGSFTL